MPLINHFSAFTKGFTEHLISTASEWILFAFLMTTFLTFIHDFRRIKILHPKIDDPLIKGILLELNGMLRINLTDILN